MQNHWCKFGYRNFGKHRPMPFSTVVLYYHVLWCIQKTRLLSGGEICILLPWGNHPAANLNHNSMKLWFSAATVKSMGLKIACISFDLSYTSYHWSCLALLCLGFLICKMQVTIVPTLEGCSKTLRKSNMSCTHFGGWTQSLE